MHRASFPLFLFFAYTAENRSNYSAPVIEALGVLVLMAAFFHILVAMLFTIVIAVVASRDAIIALPFFMFIGGLYICAPHILWLGIHHLAKPRASVVHGGYIGATTAMFISGGLVFLPPEDSVLPFLWVAYWPLAGILMVLASGIACMFHRYQQ